MEASEVVRLLDPAWSSDVSTGGAAGNLSVRLSLALRKLIVGGLLHQGARLPSERNLAEVLGVSRPTLTSSIDLLKSQGLLEARQGSGTWVSLREWDLSPMPTMAEVVLVDRGINLAAAAPSDPSHLGRLTADLGDLMAMSSGHGYHPAGVMALRSRVADHMTSSGTPTTTSQVMITPGAHGALGICVGALLAPGDRVVVEDYTYGGMLDLLAAARSQPVSVSRHREGVDPADLDRLIRRHRPSLVYLTPSIDAPTGASTSSDRMRELAEVLDSHSALVIADESLASLSSAPNPMRLASLCIKADVVEIGSLSKIAWGGLRVGWLRLPPRLQDSLMHHRSRVELGASIPSQAMSIQIMDGMDQLLASRLTTLAAQKAHLIGRLRESLPDWAFDEPDGGLCLWVTLQVADATTFTDAANHEGVAIMSGSMAKPGGGPDPHVRICFDRTTNELDEGVRRLASTWDKRSSWNHRQTK